jgi:hypothetical protein
MTNSVPGSPVIKRHSLLRRNASLTRKAFSDYYLNVHGPLASAQPGFRKFTYRYDQNHIEADLLNDSEPRFDGITMTSQVPRPDYRRGFFQERDYTSTVKPDEERLFDKSLTVSMLGEERVLFHRSEGGEKAILVLRTNRNRVDTEGVDAAPIVKRWRNICRLVVNLLQTNTASALGFGESSTAYDLLCEIWFKTVDDRLTACRDSGLYEALGGTGGGPAPEPLAFAVREIVMFSEPRPSLDNFQ